MSDRSTDPGVAGLPAELTRLLPPATVATWLTVSPLVPASAYLAGGTGLTVHLLHRVSRDLDFFCESDDDLEVTARALERAGSVLFDVRRADTLSGTFDTTKLQVFSVPRVTLLEPTVSVAGVRVASIRDILAMKLKTLIDRGALRDYFDLMTIEQQTGLTVLDGLELAIAKFHPPDPEGFRAQMLRGVRTTHDVEDDPTLPIESATVTGYWANRSRSLPRH